VAELQAQEARIEERAVELAAHRLSLSKETVLRELMRIGFAKISDVAYWNEDDVALKDERLLDDDIRAAVAELRLTPDGMRIKMHDKLGALRDLARHLGLFKHEVAVSGNVEHDVADLGSAKDILLARIEAIVVRRRANEGLAQPDG
jgi:hypothetical protein